MNSTGRSMTLEETPEFKAAVNDAVAETMARILPELIGKLNETRALLGGAVSAPVESADKHWANKLSLAIAQLTDPGRQIVAPEIMEARREATAEMMDLLVKARTGFVVNEETGEKMEVPIYTLTSKIVVDIDGCGATLIEPLQRDPGSNRMYSTRIKWPLIPNLAMKPENKSAEKIMSAFMRSVGNVLGEPTGLADGLPVPPAGGYIETDYDITNQGRAVTGLSAAQVGSRSHEGATARPRGFGIVLDEKGSAIQNSGAPYIDVNVIGTIMPPARQNG